MGRRGSADKGYDTLSLCNQSCAGSRLIVAIVLVVTKVAGVVCIIVGRDSHVVRRPTRPPQVLSLPSEEPNTHSITACTTPTTTIDTLNTGTTLSATILPLQPGLRHTTNTCAREIRLLRLHTPQTTQLLVPLLLPLGDQVRVAVVVLQQPVVQLF